MRVSTSVPEMAKPGTSRAIRRSSSSYSTGTAAMTLSLRPSVRCMARTSPTGMPRNRTGEPTLSPMTALGEK